MTGLLLITAFIAGMTCLAYRLAAWEQTAADAAWDDHLSRVVGLEEASFPEALPPLFLDEDAGQLMADEAEAWLRGEAS